MNPSIKERETLKSFQIKHSKQTQHQKPRDHKLFCSNETKKRNKPLSMTVERVKKEKALEKSKHCGKPQ